MSYQFPVTRTTTPKAKPDLDRLEFGTVFTDHMFVMDYHIDKGWHNGRIVPYGPISLYPASAVFHYAQEMFEGMKAYRSADGRALLFRPEMNEKRAAISCERICIPPLPDGLFTEAVKALVDVDRDWIPAKEGTSLYVRPFIIATEQFLGVRSSREYLFIIILSPVGPYYKEGLAPTKIYVEDRSVRAVPGGTGAVKVGGNYAACLRSEHEAHEKGYSQVLWLDGIERKYVEEIGTSNAFFVIDGEVITSPLTGSILPGITRDSVLALLKKWGKKVTERRISIQEVYDAHQQGKLEEVFASGTAAVISPVGELCWQGRSIVINDGKIGAVSQALYDELTAIQLGKKEDPFGWVVEVGR
ncbi:MAG TPA: branched chain amino acid aminotransferase [Clostridiales bacterium UBA9856]|jgi:branched-chain amino acid aminotransferase|nr:branched chain amino acid aminotransferase [Clostridiales bacterium UBA9856]HPZ59103.1 branched-chain amino acid aminotransferase [Bacillota bacterium]